MQRADGRIVRKTKNVGRRTSWTSLAAALVAGVGAWAMVLPGHAQVSQRAAATPRTAGLPAGAGARASASDVRADADRLQAKLEEIVRFGAIPRLETQTTRLLEQELNAYVWTYLMGDLPPGVTSPKIELVGDNVLRGSVVLDMDAYRAARVPSDGLDPLALLSGRVPARVRGRLVTADGVGQFKVEAADLGGIPLPASLVQRLVTYYSRTADQPEGVRIDEPFYLPVSIREIVVEPQSALIVQ